jgi:hypothetical protein
MKSSNQKIDDDTRPANEPGHRVIMSAEAYNALQKTLDQAMGEVLADRLRDIPDAEPGKTSSNCIVEAHINSIAMFSFGQAHLPYLIVRDKFSLSGYGSDHSVNVGAAFAGVHADWRRDKNGCWVTNRTFGTDGRYKMLFGDLTVEAARKAANSLVDYIRDHELARNQMVNTPPEDKVTPFMTAVAGHVIIHDGSTGHPLPDDWTGICVAGSDVKKHWYIGRSGGERSYSALQAKDMGSAVLESRRIIQTDQEFSCTAA